MWSLIIRFNWVSSNILFWDITFWKSLWWSLYSNATIFLFVGKKLCLLKFLFYFMFFHWHFGLNSYPIWFYTNGALRPQFTTIILLEDSIFCICILNTWCFWFFLLWDFNFWLFVFNCYLYLKINHILFSLQLNWVDLFFLWFEWFICDNTWSLGIKLCNHCCFLFLTH